MYNIAFSEKAEKQFFKLDTSIQERITATLDRIKTRPEYFLEELVGRKDRKLKVGDFRVICELDKINFVLLVTKIGHRRNIYDV